jgi:hypothetical protein
MRLALAAVAAVAVCACGRSPSPAKAPPDQGASVTADDFPNVRVRLRLRSQSAALPERTIEQTIWLRGPRFRIRDEAGRDLHQILTDVTAPSGLGHAPRTLEEIMDRRSAARRPPAGATEIFGDLASDAAWNYAPGSSPWSQPAHELAPIARQPLAGDRAVGLTAGAAATHLGRTATEYRGQLQVVEAGASRRNAVVRLIAPPFLLLDDVRDAGNANHFYIREVIALDLGVVTDADLARP